MEKAVYKLNADCGRSGNLEGLFVAPKKYVETLINNEIEVYFGEVLGKHSEVFGAMDEDDFELVSDDPVVVDIIEKHNLSNGFNPFDYTTIYFDFEEHGIKPDPEWGYDDMTVLAIVKQLVEIDA